MIIINFRDFMKKYSLKIDTMNGGDLQRVHKFPMYPWDSKVYSDKEFVSFENNTMALTG